MINIFICEDNKEQLQRLSKIIEAYIAGRGIDARLIAAEDDPEKLLKAAEERDGFPALFFVDVQLDNCTMDGFELVRRLKGRGRDYYFVFLTAKEELAFKAFEYDLEILDYIVKEPRYFLCEGVHEKLGGRLDKIFEKIGKDQLQAVSAPSGEMLVECGSRVVELRFCDMIYIEAIKGKHQAEIVTCDKNITVRQSLKSIHQQLPEQFYYANKSCIVNGKMIREVDKKNRYLTLQGGYRCEVSFREMQNLQGYLSRIKGAVKNGDID